MQGQYCTGDRSNEQDEGGRETNYYLRDKVSQKGNLKKRTQRGAD